MSRPRLWPLRFYGLTAPHQLVALMTAMGFLAYRGVAVNRLAGLPVPLWP